MLSWRSLFILLLINTEVISDNADVESRLPVDGDDSVRDRGENGRGLLKDVLNSALLLASKRILGTNVTNALLPVTKPIFDRVVPNADPVGFEDGRIVWGPPQTSKKQDDSQANTRVRSCTTPSREYGQCLDLSDCPSLLLQLNQLRKSICFKDLFVPGVCCPLKDIISSPNRDTTTRRPATTRPTRRTTRRPIPITTRKPTTRRPKPTRRTTRRTTTRRPPPINQDGVCGVPEVPEFRIVGGDASKPGQWPWMAAIYLHGNGRKEFWCGGALISKQYVITAAHCTKDTRGKSFNPRQFTVRLGDFNLNSTADASEVSTYRVSSYKAHPDFKINGFYNDIALFKLSTPVQFNQYTKPVCLPTDYENRPLNSLVGRTPTVIGWGTTVYGGQESEILRHVKLPVWTQKDCDNAYFQPIREMFLCAGFASGGKDACQGDSGGPLVLYENNRWMQIGIVSFGNRCAQPGYPGVFTRITNFMQWVRKNMT